MKVLIYKRVHKGDPSEEGVFGIRGCMWRLRNKISYDAVIGIGGSHPDNKDHIGIRHRINWVGIKPQKFGPPQLHKEKYQAFPLIFDHFRLFEENGEYVRKNYPKLYDYMYKVNRRFVIVDTSSCAYCKELRDEIETILDSTKDSPASRVIREDSETGDLGNHCEISTNCSR